MPVTFPPGRAKLSTRPTPTGSAVPPITTGIVVVACFAAKLASVPDATMRSTLPMTTPQHARELVRLCKSIIEVKVVPLDVAQVEHPESERVEPEVRAGLSAAEPTDTRNLEPAWGGLVRERGDSATGQETEGPKRQAQARQEAAAAPMASRRPETVHGALLRPSTSTHEMSGPHAAGSAIATIAWAGHRRPARWPSIASLSEANPANALATHRWHIDGD